MKQLNKLKQPTYLLIGILITCISACSSDSKTTDSTTPNNIETVPDINQPKLSNKPLKTTSTDEFMQHLKNGLYWNSLNGRVYMSEIDDLTTSEANVGAFADQDYSQTIIQELGVDEADRVKYDGNTIYLAINSDYYVDDSFASEAPNISNKSYVKVLTKNPDSSLSHTATIPLTQFSDDTNAQNYIQGLYLTQQKLTVVANQYNYYRFASFDIWQPPSQHFQVDIVDVNSPENPMTTDSLQIDGYLLSSRVINNTLYLVSSYQPNIKDLIYYPTSESDKLLNYQKIVATPNNDLMPKIKFAEQNQQLLVEPNQCYLPEDSQASDGYAALVTLTAIDLNQPNSIQSLCLNSQVSGIYATTESIFLYGSDYLADSFIHQFNLTDGSINYAASTTLAGHFGWEQTQLRFSQKDGNLRVVTTENTANNNNRFEHKLSILKPNLTTKTFNLIAQLPNENQPAPIGKPNEDIYAVRFFNNKAYIVTFLRTDPLYVIDLTNEEAPSVVGELEITGYSSYLHPLADNLLLGIGQEVNPEQFFIAPFSADDSSDVLPADTSEVQDGIKIALFDVSNPAEPTTLGSVYLGRGYTPAEYNYHALTYLKVSETEHRFALPIQSWSNQMISSDYNWQQTNALTLLSVKMQSTQPDDGELTNQWELIHQGDVTIDSFKRPYFISSYEDRSLLHHDLIYYIHGNQIWQSHWLDTSLVNGPY